MKKAIRDRWVKALRSGKFRRGRGQLQPTANTYCCLGVLCKVAKISYERGAHGLALSDSKKLGFQIGDLNALVSLNDGVFDTSNVRYYGLPPRGYRWGRGASFRVIADWIEEHL